MFSAQFFTHTASGQNIFESLRDSSEKPSGRGPPSEVHARNGRNLRHNSSTQTDIFLSSEHHPSTASTTVATVSLGSIGGERLRGRVRGEEAAAEPGVYGDMRKPFSTGSLHAMSLRPSSELTVAGRYGGPSAFQECCPYARGPTSLPYDPVSAPDCVVGAEAGSEKKHSGGTWPKVLGGGGGGSGDGPTAMAAPTQLSIYKSPKQRKSIFDPDTFKRPETPSAKLEYVAAGQTASHSPQPSKADSLSSSSTATPTPTPPTPPTRTDSFKFKHKHQSSSASDCTVTSDGAVSAATGDPGPGRERGGRERDRNGNHYFLDAKVLTSRKSCDEDIGRTRGEEPEVKRPRPKSAPALRRRMTPQPFAMPTFQVSRDHLSAAGTYYGIVVFTLIRLLIFV